VRFLAFQGPLKARWLSGRHSSAFASHELGRNLLVSNPPSLAFRSLVPDELILVHWASRLMCFHCKQQFRDAGSCRYTFLPAAGSTPATLPGPFR
jgi:hypothetical protein